MHIFDNNTVVFNEGRITTDILGLTTYSNRTIYSMLTPKIITNTLVETSHFDDTNAKGTRTIAANVLEAGDVIRIYTRIDFSSVGNPTNAIKLLANSVELVSHTATLGAAHTNTYAATQVDILVLSTGETGSLVCMGKTSLVGGAERALVASSPITIDTTQPITFDLTYTWGAASSNNILKAVMATFQLLG